LDPIGPGPCLRCPGPSQNKATNTRSNRSHGQQQSRSQPIMRKLTGASILGGNIAPRAGNPKALTQPQYAAVNRVRRQPAPKTRHPNLTSSYGGAEVSLDPALLAPVPEPNAVKQIKRAIPAIPRLMNGEADMPKMISMLIAHAKGDLSAAATQSGQNTQVHGPRKTDTPGADFDRLFNSLSESGLVAAKKPAN